ncbi:MAG: hypothetical protein COA77_05685 [Thaumarchaeota archaeon]|nr:MAG: hypothetical protein COA77_05685 [Nitrososphaerota archaeon]
MTKVLYVRGFSEKIHDELNEMAKKEGVTPAAIIEDAIENWKKQKEEITKNHHLVLYSDEESLMYFIKKMDDATKNDWYQGYNNSQSSNVKKFLTKQGWQDVSINLKQTKKPEQFHDGMYKKFSESKYKQACIIGIVKPESLKSANKFENIYNNKRINGVVLCIYNTNDVFKSDFNEILNLFEEHDRIFILRNKEVIELSLNKQNPLKILF